MDNLLTPPQQLHRYASEKASTIYDTITFKTVCFYNRKAPEPIVAFAIGVLLTGISALYWIRRWFQVSRSLDKKKYGWPITLRVVIATLSDNDDPAFTILRIACQGMLFLGGFQLNYQLTFVVMLIYYTVISVGDSARVMLSLYRVTHLEDLVIVSRQDHAYINVTKQEESGNHKIVIESTNVYEDLSRNYIIVGMVFITQVVLIAFVVVDVFNTDTMSALDGTAGVPIVGTLGSWLIYCLGIFMQSVYILGPKTSYGTSEQNPHFWWQLLLSAKHAGARAQWYDLEKNTFKSRELSPSDRAVWARFLMSFAINGVGFHILIHALPIQVAGQSSLTGVVFRAVGMMYLVDLDDAPGTKLEIIEHKQIDNNADVSETVTPQGSQEEIEVPAGTLAELGVTTEEPSAQDLVEAAREKANEIQRELTFQLDELAKKYRGETFATA